MQNKYPMTDFVLPEKTVVPPVRLLWHTTLSVRNNNIALFVSGKHYTLLQSLGLYMRCSISLYRPIFLPFLQPTLSRRTYGIPTFSPISSICCYPPCLIYAFYSVYRGFFFAFTRCDIPPDFRCSAFLVRKKP